MDEAMIQAALDAAAGVLASSGMFGAIYIAARKRARAWVAAIVRDETREMAEDVRVIARAIIGGAADSDSAGKAEANHAKH